MDQILAAAWEYLYGLITNPYNLAILGLSWGLVEVFAPLFRLLIAAPDLNKVKRVRLLAWARAGKRLAAVIWCSALVWVPTFQPPLCTAGPVDGCQSLAERLLSAILMGLVLSAGHNVIAKQLRRFNGSRKLHKIKCAQSNCGKVIEVVSLTDPCPCCGRTPHERTAS